MGANYLQIYSEGDLNIRVKFQYRAYSKQDPPPPNHSKTVLVQVLRHIASIAAASPDKELKAISYMIQLAYFFFLRSGRYMGTKYPQNPFHLKDVSLICGAANFDTRKNLTDALKTATDGKLDFMTYKNAMQGKLVGHRPSDDALL